MRVVEICVIFFYAVDGTWDFFVQICILVS